MSYFNARVFLGVVICYLARAICGSVVDKNNLEILVGLGDDGVKTSGEVFFGIINRDDNRDEWLSGQRVWFFHDLIISFLKKWVIV